MEAEKLIKLWLGHPKQAIKSGYLFAAKSGRPPQQRNVLRALHATGKKVGLHVFRRFRTETLRRARVPKEKRRKPNAGPLQGYMPFHGHDFPILHQDTESPSFQTRPMID